MLTIRTEQPKAFSQLEVEKYAEWMLAHLRRFFPRQCTDAGEAQLRTTIRDGIKRSSDYEIVSKRDVCKFIDLMVVFGKDFDTDKRFPWAGEILSQNREPGAKTDALHEAAMKHLRQT